MGDGDDRAETGGNGRARRRENQLAALQVADDSAGYRAMLAPAKRSLLSTVGPRDVAGPPAGSSRSTSSRI